MNAVVFLISNFIVDFSDQSSFQRDPLIIIKGYCIFWTLSNKIEQYLSPLLHNQKVLPHPYMHVSWPCMCQNFYLHMKPSHIYTTRNGEVDYNRLCHKYQPELGQLGSC